MFHAAISTLVGLFTGKHGKLMWQLVGVLSIVAVLGGAYLFFQHTRSENAKLKTVNAQLEAAVKERDKKIIRLAEDQALYIDRTNRIMNEIGVLQDRFSKNAIRRQQDIDNIVTRPGTKATIGEIREKANSGMNGLFNDLETLSREDLNAKSN